VFYKYGNPEGEPAKVRLLKLREPEGEPAEAPLPNYGKADAPLPLHGKRLSIRAILNWANGYDKEPPSGRLSPNARYLCCRWGTAPGDVKEDFLVLRTLKRECRWLVALFSTGGQAPVTL
jgi:hypothetical protein